MQKKVDVRQNEPVAIIGVSGIFPGSNTVAEFFENILRKRCFIRELPDWVWEKEVFFDEDQAAALKTYSHIGALFGDIEVDLDSFHIPPTVASQISLNQKLALVCAREALADAGYLERDFNRERTGVIIAATAGELWQRHSETTFAQNLRTRLEQLCRDPEQEQVLRELWIAYESKYPNFPINEDSLPGSIGSLVTGRIASVFDLNGLQFILDSACASSLTAVATAVTNLRSGVCDMVITGGVETEVSEIAYVALSKVSALSGNGCYPFDERADGFVVGQGCGLMLLKRYADAVRDGDRIYALIRGVGNSSDGAGKGVLAPNSKGQVLALKQAYRDAAIEPSTVQYIECHGTGTRVGDITELNSVNQFIAESDETGKRQSPLAVGSVKAMVGHCKKAAGMAGLFRALLTVNSRVIPPQVNFEEPNPEFDWENACVRIPRRPEPVSDDEVHVGVSGFGFGGANAHVVLSSSPVNAREPLVNADDLMLPEPPSLCNDIAFLFPGQGAQYIGMLESLREDPVAKSYLDLADELVLKISGLTLSDFIYPPSMAQENIDQLSRHGAILRDTAIAQPAIFVISAILLEKVRRLGIEPGMMLGHSLGEYTALYAAGVLSFEDALRAVAMRGCLMMKASTSDPGTMAFVEGNFEQVGRIVRDVKGYVVCANLNSYDQTVLSGETAAINQVVELAAERGINAHTLNVDRAFHSRIVSSCVAPMRIFLETLEYRTVSTPIPANIRRQVYPFVRDSGSAGALMNAADRDRVIDLLCRQIDHSVDFVSQVELAYEAGVRRFVEIGPKSVLTHLVDDMLQGKPFQAINLDDPGEDSLRKLNSLKEELSRPLTISRRPLPTKPWHGETSSPDAGSFAEFDSAEDKVRAVVAAVSGYSFEQIDDDAEFERDLGIDTLKNIQIISLLRGRILPEKFTSFRNATSVRKIVSMAKAAGFVSEASSVPASTAQPMRDVHCFRYGAVTEDLGSIASPSARLNAIIDPELSFLKESLVAYCSAHSDINGETLLLWSLPDNPYKLCKQTIPDLLQRVIKIADMSKQARGKPAVHIITLSSREAFNEAAYYALTGLTKSMQKDLPYLRFSYHHVDSLCPNENLLRRVVADTTLGGHIFPDGKIEQGRLIPHSDIDGSVEELADLLGEDDVVLVTGGARGIAAAVVRRLIRLVRSRFVLIGRKPHKESWIDAEGLGRIEYLAGDLCDTDAVRSLGLAKRNISLVVHAAGVVISRPMKDILRSEIDQILGAKVLGIHRILDELDLSQVRGVVNFSSISGYIGGDGHPDYAAGNAYLNGLRAESLPVLSIGWSAWGQVGMASREGTRQFLEMAGVEPIPLQQAVDTFGALLSAFLKSEKPGVQNFVVHAGLADSCFLPNDPYRSAMTAALRSEQGQPAETSENIRDKPVEPAYSAQSSLDSLTSCIVSPPTALGVEDTEYIVLRLGEAAEYGRLHDELYTPSEKREIALLKSEKRRREKYAGKLAVKIIASATIGRWLGKEYEIGDFQVLSSSTPVNVSLFGEHIDKVPLEDIFFSISHNDDIVCAAVARKPVGIDVETIRTLSPETVKEICDEPLRKMIDDYIDSGRDVYNSAKSDADALPVTLFTRKEAILKASGDGLGNGLAEVILHDVAIGSPSDATYRGSRYLVTSMTDRECVYSFAWLIESSPTRRNSHSNDSAGKIVTPSFGQEGIWFQEKLKGTDSTHCIAWSDRLSGQLDIHALRQSVQHIVDRHEAIRATFSDAKGDFEARVLDSVTIDLPLVDLGHLAPDAAEREIDRRCADDMDHGFRLEEGPLFRMRLFRAAADEHILFFNFHHIIIDVTSAFAFRQELALCYRAFIFGQRPELPPLPFQYSDFALAQRESLNSRRLEELVSFWRQTLSGCPASLDLPTDYSQKPVQSFPAQHVTFELSADMLRTLRKLSGDEGVTLFVTFLAAFQALLMRLSGESDIVVGTPFVGRDNLGLFPTIGYFINMLALRTDMSENPKFRTLLSAVQKTFLDALEHHELPFQKLVEELNPHRHANHTPFFRTVICLLHEDYRQADMLGLDRELTEIPPRNTEYDLSLFVNVQDAHIHGRFEYNSGLFKKRTIQHISDCFTALLEAVARDPALHLSQIPLLTDSQADQIIRAWNDTERSIPVETVNAIFSRMAKQTPDATAVICSENQLTYGQLEDRSNQLAHYLIKRGLQPKNCVGIAVNRSVETVVCILGVLKAGGAYIPLDAADPSDRLSFIMSDSNIRFLLTQEKMGDYFPSSGMTRVFVDREMGLIHSESKRNPVVGQDNDHLAYVMYTSGTTGRPKGVAVTHKAIVRLLFGVDYVDLGASRTILQMAPMTFDASTFELWGALLHGGRCVLFPDRVPTIAAIKSTLQQHKIDTLWLTASLFNTLIDEAPESLAGVRQLLTGGEALSVAHVRRAIEFLPETEIINGYGPTESTTFACCYRIPRNIDEGIRSIPIGRPIANTTAYILDRWENPVPVGVRGELHIGGLGLARGYVNRPELNAEKFIPNPFSEEPHGRLYKTGDLARYLPDGNIEFLGRLDNQVKIRGFRVEPEEIESVLRRHQSVEDAVVVTRGDTADDKRLSGYIVKQDGYNFSPSELRDYLQDYLPGYMVPHEWFTLDVLPLTPNGKVDRAGLMARREECAESSGGFMIPRTTIERRLAKIWTELLCNENIGIQDDFFELGGHSLLAVRLFSEIERIFGKTLPFSALFQSSTLGQLANVIGQNVSISEDSSLVPMQTSGAKTPLFLIPPAATTSLQFINMVRELDRSQPVYGIDPVGLYDKRSYLVTVEEIASHNVREMQRIQPKGPYLIGGICFGVRVAYEMAQQIQRQGQEVGLLIVFDSSPPRLKPKVTFYLKRYISGIASHLRKQNGSTDSGQKEDNFARQTICDNSMPEDIETRTRIILQAHEKARRRYFARKYNGPVALFQSEQVLHEKNVYSKWKNAVLNGVDHYTTIAGSSHYGLFFEEQHYKLLAMRLNEILSGFHEKRHRLIAI